MPGLWATEPMLFRPKKTGPGETDLCWTLASPGGDLSFHLQCKDPQPCLIGPWGKLMADLGNNSVLGMGLAQSRPSGVPNRIGQ